MGNTYDKLLDLVTTPPQKKDTKKEAVEEYAKKSENQQINKSEDVKKVRKSTNQQGDKAENQHFDNEDVSTKTSKRFTTYLTKTSLREIRRIADDEDRHDYEIFQEAIDLYIKHKRE